MKASVPGIHVPKVETFDLPAMTNTDPKGHVRAVDTYRRERWGLYMARPADHARFHYIESWLLPTLGLRATVFHFTPGHVADQDLYLDVGDFTDGGDVWHSEDHYLDLVVRTGREVELLDVDELLAAYGAGVLDAGRAERAVRIAASAIDGIAAHGHDADRWLAACGMPVSWR